MATSRKTRSDGFSEAERAAMKERSRELKAQGRSGQKRADNAQAVLDAIAEMPDDDRALAERIHALVIAHAPGLLPKTWYGMPAYANTDGKVVCFFKAAAKFDGRYAVLGFEDAQRSTTGRCGPLCSRSSTGTPTSRRRLEVSSRLPLPDRN